MRKIAPWTALIFLLSGCAALFPVSTRPSLPKKNLGMMVFYTPADVESKLAELKRLGITLVRVQPDLARSQRRGHIPWEWFDSAIKAAEKHDMKLLILLGYAPQWLMTDTQLAPTWQEIWVEELVKPVLRRYATHPNIWGWEVWNEPQLNLSGFTMTKEEYLELLKKTYQTIKKMDPKARVVSAATINYIQSTPKIFADNLWYIENGITRYSDVFNLHLYAKWEDPLDIAEIIAASQAIKKALGNHPVIISEFGRRGFQNHEDTFRNLAPLVMRVLNPEYIVWFLFEDVAANTPDAIKDAKNNTFALKIIVSDRRDPIYSPLYEFLKKY